jgi:uncharacterized membrane protein
MDITPGKDTVKQPSSYSENLKHAISEMHLQFPKFKHEKHVSVIDVNKVSDEKLTIGQKIADAVASGMGSWTFIITQTVLLAVWIILNLVAWVQHWDPYPFIFLNLALSFQAAYAAPIIMMSQNRQAEKDRLTAQNDFQTDCRGEEEVRHIMDHLDHQDEMTRAILLRLETEHQRMEEQEKIIMQIVQQLESQHEGFSTQHQEILQRLSDLKH